MIFIIIIKICKRLLYYLRENYKLLHSVIKSIRQPFKSNSLISVDNVKSIFLKLFKGFSLGLDRLRDANEFSESVSISCLNLNVFFPNCNCELLSVDISFNPTNGDISIS
jgi:hypothetical protein